jgi:sporulation protein YpjB
MLDILPYDFLRKNYVGGLRMFKLISKQTVTGLLICLLLIPVAACSSSSMQQNEPSKNVDEAEFKKMEKLNILAEKFYTDVNESKLEEARADIIELNEQVTHIHFQGAASPEGIEALMETLITAKQVFTAVKPSMNEAVFSAAKVRLAVDALTHPKNPMWLHYYKILIEDGKVLSSALEMQEQEKMNHALNQIMNHYEVIRPAMLINREPAEVLKVDSYLKYLKTEPNLSAMSHYDGLMSELFHRKASTAYLELERQQQNPIFWAMTVGAIIVSALVYVGWRKYQYERNHFFAKKQKKREGDL